MLPRFCSSLKAACMSMYFWASVVYCVYVYQILAINYCDIMYPRTPLPFFNDTNSSYVSYDYDYVIAPQCKQQGDTPINRQYIAASSIHILNGVMFGLVWVPYFAAHPELTLKIKLALLAPEVCNIMEASFYVKSATLYGEAWATCSAECELIDQIHTYETIAAFLELFASFGWYWSWYVTHTPGRGRGVTVWDPDFLGAVGLIIPSIIYVVYNLQNLANPEGYATNSLFLVADVMYGIDAPFYLFAALRDVGFFWWLRCIPGCADSPEGHRIFETGSVSPTAVPLDDNDYGTVR